MKKGIFIIAATMLCSSASAQITIAPEAGINLARATAKSDLPPYGTLDLNTSMKIGFKAGAMVRIPIVSGLFVEPGLFYSMKGTKTKFDMSFLGQTIKMEGSATFNYLELPVNLGYKFDFGDAGGVFVTAGPYLGYALSGKSKAETFVNGVSEGKDDSDIDFGSDSGEMKRMDFGVNFGAGYQSPMGLYLRVQYGLGLANLSNTDNTTYKNKVLSFSIGYGFEL